MIEQKLVTIFGTSLAGNFHKGFLGGIWSPVAEQLRHRNRVNFKRPLPLHFERAKMVRLVAPAYPDEVKLCKVAAEEREKTQPIEDNPYGVFLAKSMREDFYNYPLIAIYHNNQFNEQNILAIRGMLFDSKFDMKLAKRQNAKVMTLALRGTKFEPVLRLTSCQTTLGYCSDRRVDKLLQVSKKMPQFVLLGAVMDDRLMNRADLETYASTNIDLARAQFCHTLNSAGVALNRTLGMSASLLSHSLQTYSSPPGGEETSGDKSAGEKSS